MGLTARQEAFAREYAARGVGSDAAVAAGYSERRAKQSAAELLRHPEVAALVVDLQQERAAELGLDARALVDEALKYHHGALAGEFPASVGVRALDLAARLLGAFAPTRHEERRVVVTMKLGPE